MRSLNVVYRTWLSGALSIVLSVSGLLHAAEPTPPEEMNRLMEQLASPQFKERDAAFKKLTAIGEPALPALRQALKSGDKEMQRRAGELIASIESRVASTEIMKPTKVNIKANNTPLADVLRDLSKQSKMRLFLAQEPPDLGDRPVTLDTGETTFWQGLDELCRQAKIHLRPASQGLSTKNGQGNAGNSAPTGQTYRLVLEDGAVPEQPTAYIGAVRVKLLHRAYTGKPGEQDGRWVVEVLSEPKLHWQEALSLLWDEATGGKGQRLPGIPSVEAAPAQDDDDGNGVGGFVFGGNGMSFIGGPGGRAAGPQDVRRMEILLKWNVPADSEEAALRGRFKGAVQVSGVAVHVSDIKKARGGDVVSVRKGVKLNIEKFEKKKNGEVDLEVALEREQAGAGQGGMRINFQGGGQAAGNGGFRVWDDKDRPYKVEATIDSNEDGKTIYQLTLTPPAKDSVPMRLELHGPYSASIEQAFILRNIRAK